MKLFNEIESEVNGTIVKILVDDASPVEYDQPLFLVEPAWFENEAIWKFENKFVFSFHTAFLFLAFSNSQIIKLKKCSKKF